VTAARAHREPIDWSAVSTIVRRDFTAILRSRAVLLPMLIVPFLLLVILPIAVGLASTRTQAFDISQVLEHLPGRLADPIRAYPMRQQLVVMVLGYLVAPLFMIVPLMVSAVLSADAFAGEKERKTLESLLHLPVNDRDLFLAKLLGALIPSIGISWIGFVLFTIASNTAAWGVMHQIFLPTWQWLLLIFWVAPAVATAGQGIMVRISARARNTQEANQLGGTVILPMVILAVGQTTTLLVLPLPVCFTVGLVIWALAIWLNVRGSRRYTRERLAPGI
jgi:ABC-type Na+ efflux pump permease subunit